MKNNSNYVRSPKKSYPSRPILHEFDTLFTLHTYSAGLVKKDPFYVNFWTSLILPLHIQVAPQMVQETVSLSPVSTFVKIECAYRSLGQETHWLRWYYRALTGCGSLCRLHATKKSCPALLCKLAMFFYMKC